MIERDEKMAKTVLNGVINNLCNAMYLNLYLHTIPNHSVHGPYLMIKQGYENESVETMV
jgi:hypothetical protein